MDKTKLNRAVMEVRMLDGLQIYNSNDPKITQQRQTKSKQTIRKSNANNIKTIKKKLRISANNS